MRRGRYATLDNWWTVERREVRPWFADGPPPVLVIQACDVLEDSGHVWHGSGRRVLLDRGKIEGFRRRTFIGEMAWCEAQNFVDGWEQKASMASHGARFM